MKGIIFLLVLTGLFVLVYPDYDELERKSQERNRTEKVLSLEKSSDYQLSGLRLIPTSEIEEVSAEELQIREAKAAHLQVVIEEINHKEPTCDLSFVSNNSGLVTPPDAFVAELVRYSCKEQQILTRLAYYESTWNKDAINGYFQGYYQIGSGDTRNYVVSVIGERNDHDMALWIFNNYPSWFESVTNNSNSFVM